MAVTDPMTWTEREWRAVETNVPLATISIMRADLYRHVDAAAKAHARLRQIEESRKQQIAASAWPRRAA